MTDPISPTSVISACCPPVEEPITSTRGACMPKARRISAGCADVYGVDLGCQYLDVTGVPDGNYTLRITVDPFGRIPELDETNNVATLAVTLGAGDPCTAVTDIPADGPIEPIRTGAIAQSPETGPRPGGPEDCSSSWTLLPYEVER